MSCEAKINCVVKDRGKSSIEFHINGKPQYYCYGYYDQRTDELIDECKRCKREVHKAQEDLERYRKEVEKDANI